MNLNHHLIQYKIYFQALQKNKRNLHPKKLNKFIYFTYSHNLNYDSQRELKHFIKSSLSA